MDGWMDRWMGEWVDIWMVDGLMDRWIDGWMGGSIIQIPGPFQVFHDVQNSGLKLLGSLSPIDAHLVTAAILRSHDVGPVSRRPRRIRHQYSLRGPKNNTAGRAFGHHGVRKVHRVTPVETPGGAFTQISHVEPQRHIKHRG